MESKAAELLSAFKNPNLSTEVKVSHLTGIKSDIKQKNVPEGAIPTIFDALKLAISSQHPSVASAGFSTLGHLLKRLTIQDQQQWILSQSRGLYSILLDRLGDHRERVRAQSASIFTDLWPLSNDEAEYHVLQCALVGKNARAKEMSLLWLSNMTRNHGLKFRQYVPSLVACLEDADSAVRDTARLVVVELFRNAPARAKSDLQKQLVARGVRKSIASFIISGIGLSAAEPESATRPVSRVDRPISVMSSRSRAVDVTDDEREPSKGRPASRAHHDRSTNSKSVEPPMRPKTPAEAPTTSSQEEDRIEPLLVSSSRDIDDMTRDMLPWFEGKESEENWIKREKNCLLLRRLTRGNAPQEFIQTFVGAIKTLLDGIFKSATSLRTTLCTAGCLLMQEIARTCGPRIDSMVEIIMQNLTKLCASLKKIAAQNGNSTVQAVIENVSFNVRLLQHVYMASQDKNLQLRLFAPGWLQTLINRQSNHKSSVEHGGGLDIVEKSIKKGLGDANPGVREAMRSTFWTFYGVWPERADGIMDSLDSKSRTLLERDSSNPNVSMTSKSSAPAKSVASSAASRSALKEAIAARRKAAMPSRPDSVQSILSESHASDTGHKSSSRTVPTGAPLSSLSSAPMRPAMKPRRPEVNRPATADPYARRPESRTAQTASKLPVSPRSVRSKTSTPSSRPINPPRLRPHEGPGQTGTTRGKPKKLDLSKSKSHGDLHAVNVPLSDSNESLVNQPYLRPHDVERPMTLEVPSSPAPVSLESPPFSAVQPPSPYGDTPDPDYDLVSRSVALEASQPQSFEEESIKEQHIEEQHVEEQYVEEQHVEEQHVEEQHIEEQHIEEQQIEEQRVEEHFEDSVSAPTSPNAPRSVAATPSKHFDLGADTDFAVQSQNEEMIIYEDPATPIAVEPLTSTHDHVEPFTPTNSSYHADQESDLGYVVEDQIAAATPTRTPHSVIGMLGSDGASEIRLPTPMHRTPLHGSPSPTKSLAQATPNVPGVGPDSTLHPVSEGQNLPKLPNKEKENLCTPKVATPRSTPKQGSLEGPLNESVLNLVEARSPFGSPPRLSISIQPAPPRRARRWAERHRSPSPRSKDPVNAREMLRKANSRITAKTMDISGYRKLQGLFQYHGLDIVSREKDYYAVLDALLNELESAPSSRKDHDVKTQILATIRSMLLRTSDLFHRYDVPAVAAIILTRHHYESSSHFVTCLEEVEELLVSLVPVQSAIDGALQALEMGEDVNSEKASRTLVMGMNTIKHALSHGPSEISDETLASIGAVAGRYLNHSRPTVRKAATELCTQLNLQFGLDRVQKLTQPAGEGSLNLLTYFMARAR